MQDKAGSCVVGLPPAPSAEEDSYFLLASDLFMRRVQKEAKMQTPPSEAQWKAKFLLSPGVWFFMGLLPPLQLSSLARGHGVRGTAVFLAVGVLLAIALWLILWWDLSRRSGARNASAWVICLAMYYGFLMGTLVTTSLALASLRRQGVSTMEAR